jgi:hypothetical protein
VKSVQYLLGQVEDMRLVGGNCVECAVPTWSGRGYAAGGW